MREEIQYCEQNLLMLLVIYEIISVIYVLSLPHWTQTLGLFPIFLSSCMVFKNKRGSWGNLKIFSHLPASHLPTPLPLAFQQPAPVSLFFFLFFFFFKHQQLLSQKWLIVSCLRLYLFTLGQGGHFLWLFTALPPLHHLFSLTLQTASAFTPTSPSPQDCSLHSPQQEEGTECFHCAASHHKGSAHQADCGMGQVPSEHPIDKMQGTSVSLHS